MPCRWPVAMCAHALGKFDTRDSPKHCVDHSGLCERHVELWLAYHGNVKYLWPDTISAPQYTPIYVTTLLIVYIMVCFMGV